MAPIAPKQRSVVIIGGGPAGLTAAYELSKHSVPAVVLEADATVGGLSRTVNYKGYLFDIGGHPFFTKWDEVNKLWGGGFEKNFPEGPRVSRAILPKKFFFYPLKSRNRL